MPVLSVPGALVGGDEVSMAVFHELSRAEGPSQQTANFRQTAPEIHVSPGFAAHSWPAFPKTVKHPAARATSARISRILVWRWLAPVPTGTIARRRQNMEFYTWDEMEKEVLSDTIARKIISGDKAMVAQVFLAKGAIVPEHHHESEQITYILEGALKFEIGGREIVVGKGQVLRIPCNVPHRAVALEDTLDLDIFSPIREDWLKKDDAYLRG